MVAEPTVLVLEDDPAVCELLAEILGDRYSVTLVGRAHDALHSLSKSVPDLLLSDCVLPGGGLDQVLAKADAAGVSVLLTSGHPVHIKMRRGERPFLAKPYKLVDLLAVVGNIIEKGRTVPAGRP